MLLASSRAAGEGRDELAERELDRTSLGDHIDRLYRAAWGYCGSREDAEDLVQETFVRVMARPRLLRNDALPIEARRCAYVRFSPCRR